MLIGYAVDGLLHISYLEFNGQPHSLDGPVHILKATRTENSVTITHSSPSTSSYGIGLLISF